jgi:hypothetical protein
MALCQLSTFNTRNAVSDGLQNRCFNSPRNPRELKIADRGISTSDWARLNKLFFGPIPLEDWYTLALRLVAIFTTRARI